MRHSTPFFKAFGSLLFGKPPVSGLSRALAKFSESTSLCQLRKVFGSLIPQALLSPTSSGDNSRRRNFPLEVVFWSFLHQVQTPNGSCREAVRKVMADRRRKFPRETAATMSPDTAAYCTARAKIPTATLDKINDHLAERLQRHIPEANLWHGRHVKLVDGTGISMPDTPANQSCWPQSKSQKPGCGFPLLNLVGIFCMLSGALIKTAHGDRHTHETKLFQRLWDVLVAGDVLLADRGFFSFSAFAGLLAKGVDALIRLPEKKLRVAIGARLPKSKNFDVVITWNRPAHPTPAQTPQEFTLLPESLTVRVVRYSIARRGFRTRSVTLVTTLLDAAIAASELAELYFRRWDIELHLREIKVHLHMDVLRCLSPHMIERELRMHVIAYNLIRCVMQKAALAHGADLKRLSFKGCLDTVRQFANAVTGAEDKPRTIAAIIEEMLLAIARDPVPLRPGRSEPRVKKRRAKNYRLMTKPRHKMGPLPHRKSGVEKRPKRVLS